MSSDNNSVAMSVTDILKRWCLKQKYGTDAQGRVWIPFKNLNTVIIFPKNDESPFLLASLGKPEAHKEEAILTLLVGAGLALSALTGPYAGIDPATGDMTLRFVFTEKTFNRLNPADSMAFVFDRIQAVDTAIRNIR